MTCQRRGCEKDIDILSVYFALCNRHYLEMLRWLKNEVDWERIV
jgi:hypothetical protein